MQSIEWDEPAEPRRMSMLVADKTNGDTKRATPDDLRRACEAVGLLLCECVEQCNGCRCEKKSGPGAPLDHIAHIQSALEQSEAARADLADKLDEAQANLAWAKRCVELVQSAPVGNADAEGFMLDAVALSAKMSALSPADVMRRDFSEYEGSKP
jgi:hypothetical protein